MRQNNAILFTALFCVGLLASPLAAAGPSLLGGGPNDEKRGVSVNNRILAKVHGKVISVIDVQKKLDVIFYRRFPEYASMPSMRYQFYQINWRPVLSDLIDKELILYDAKEAKIEVTRGDVRQEMEQLFGPNIVANLDQIGLNIEDAREMTEGDLRLRRMMGLRVNVKAQQRVGPAAVRKAYEEFAQSNKRPTEWVYQVISVRNADPVKGLAAATLLRDQLVSNKETIEQLAKDYQNIEGLDPFTKVSFSEEYRHTENDASEAYKDILQAMESNSYSQPIAQQSRAKDETIHRIFFLREMTPGGNIPFAQVEGALYDKLIGDAVIAETEAYLTRLRKQAGVTKESLDQLVPPDFEPFLLK